MVPRMARIGLWRELAGGGGGEGVMRSLDEPPRLAGEPAVDIGVAALGMGHQAMFQHGDLAQQAVVLQLQLRVPVLQVDFGLLQVGDEHFLLLAALARGDAVALQELDPPLLVLGGVAGPLRLPRLPFLLWLLLGLLLLLRWRVGRCHIGGVSGVRGSVKLGLDARRAAGHGRLRLWRRRRSMLLFFGRQGQARDAAVVVGIQARVDEEGLVSGFAAAARLERIHAVPQARPGHLGLGCPRLRRIAQEELLIVELGALLLVVYGTPVAVECIWVGVRVTKGEAVAKEMGRTVHDFHLLLLFFAVFRPEIRENGGSSAGGRGR